jgi:hypothetical protein
MPHNTFIIAPSGKSGSTLLSWMLNQHPNYFNYEFKEWYPLGKMLNTLDWMPGQAETNPNMVPPGFADSVRNWYYGMVNPQNVEHCGVKFTNFWNFRYLRYLFRNDPIIVIVRHPIDNFISFKHWEIKHGVTPPDPTEWFMNRIPPALESISNTSNHLLLYFEDLIQHPQRVIDQCCDYLGFSRYSLNLTEHIGVYNNLSGLAEYASFDHDKTSLVQDVLSRRTRTDLITNEEREQLKNAVTNSGVLNGLMSRYAADFM